MLEVGKCEALRTTYLKKGQVESEQRINLVKLSCIVKKFATGKTFSRWQKRILIVTNETVDLFRPISQQDMSLDKVVLVRRVFYKNLRALSFSQDRMVIHVSI